VTTKINPGAFWLVISLVIITILGAAVRKLTTSDDDTPTGDTVWLVNVRADFVATEAKAMILLSPPFDTRYSRNFGRNLLHPGQRIRKASGNLKQTRDIGIQAREPGDHYLDADFLLHISPVPRWPTEKTTLTAQEREVYFQSTDKIQADDAYITSTLQVISRGHYDEAMLVKRIFDFVHTKISPVKRSRNPDAVSTIKTGRGTALARANAMTALSRAAKVPARLVTGFVLQKPYTYDPHHWVELYVNDAWRPYDPVYGYENELPSSYVAFKKNGDSIITVPTDSPVTALNVQYEVSQQDLSSSLLKPRAKNFSDVTDLTRLPLSTQTMLATLFLLPLGALFTTFCRNVIGIRTYGTFTPTLLALAATFTDWITATMIFSVVAVLGVGGRSLLPDSHLGRVPRLSVVFTLVAIAMALGVSILEYFRLNPAAGGVVLLPIVILTGLVDRFYTVADENGLRNALIRLAWTGVVGLGCLVILNQESLGYLLLAYPELHLGTVAAIILLGLYRGKKLMDFTHVTWLMETKPAKKKIS
jgi:transglutaminase-like putative cysteine protease